MVGGDYKFLTKVDSPKFLCTEHHNPKRQEIVLEGQLTYGLSSARKILLEQGKLEVQAHSFKGDIGIRDSVSLPMTGDAFTHNGERILIHPNLHTTYSFIRAGNSSLWIGESRTLRDKTAPEAILIGTFYNGEGIPAEWSDIRDVPVEKVTRELMRKYGLPIPSWMPES